MKINNLLSRRVHSRKKKQTRRRESKLMQTMWEDQRRAGCGELEVRVLFLILSRDLKKEREETLRHWPEGPLSRQSITAKAWGLSVLDGEQEAGGWSRVYENLEQQSGSEDTSRLSQIRSHISNGVTRSEFCFKRICLDAPGRTNCRGAENNKPRNKF